MIVLSDTHAYLNILIPKLFGTPDGFAYQQPVPNGFISLKLKAGWTSLCFGQAAVCYRLYWFDFSPVCVFKWDQSVFWAACWLSVRAVTLPSAVRAVGGLGRIL